MRFFGFLIAASLAMALLQAAAKLAGLLAIIAGIGAFYARPKESIGCLFTLGLISVVGRYPLVALATLIGTATAGIVAKRASR